MNNIKKRGFGSMAQEVIKSLGRVGGIKTALRGNGHKFTSNSGAQAVRQRKVRQVTISPSRYDDKYSLMDIPAWKRYILRHPERSREMKKAYYQKKRGQL